ncbi:MAG: EamA family transporter [Chitinophagaceae bacterium]|nr:EamA family transporter [Chitinophagaceae bacterium]
MIKETTADTPIKDTTASDPQSAQGISYYFSKFNPLHFKKRGRRGKALIALGAVCFLWGTTWIASKEAVRHMPALQMIGIRQFFGGLCYVIFFIAKRTPIPKGREWRNILILTFLNFMLSNALSTWGVKYIGAGLGSIIGAIFPLWLVIIGLVSAKTKLQVKTVIGLLLGFTGVCVIFYEHLHEFLNPQFRFGIFLSLTSTWTWAFGTIYTKKHAATFNPYFSLGLQMVISGIILFTISNLAHSVIPIASIPWQSWAAIGYLVIFGSVLSFIAYLYALQNLPTEQVSLYAYINPIVAVLLGWMIFAEILTPFIIAGALITLYGVYLVNNTIAKIT